MSINLICLKGVDGSIIAVKPESVKVMTQSKWLVYPKYEQNKPITPPEEVPAVVLYITDFTEDSGFKVLGTVQEIANKLGITLKS